MHMLHGRNLWLPSNTGIFEGGKPARERTDGIFYARVFVPLPEELPTRLLLMGKEGALPF